MKEIPVSEFRQDLADVINQVAYAGDRVILERRGKKLCAVIPIEDLERLLGEKTDSWQKFERRGHVIEKLNRAHIQSITPESAIRDVETLLHDSAPAPTDSPLPTSVSRLMNRGKHGHR